MVTSNAAIATLTVPVPILKNDSLLTFIIQLLPPGQIKISSPKKGNSISLSINEDSNVITERNAILRTLCGITLLNKLDNYPLCLLGGYAESTASGASSEASLVLASIGSYMSVASMVRTGDEKEANILLQLNEVLAQNSFLVGSTFKPTLADYDVFFALVEKTCLKAESLTKEMTHLKRWALAVQYSIEELISSNNLPVKGLPEFSAPTLDFGVADLVPMFYFGDEENVSAPTSASKAAPATAPSTKGGNGKDQQKGNGGKKELTDEEKKAAADKRAQKAAEKAKKKAKNAAAAGGKGAASAPAAVELNITALDIRVGKIIEVWEHEDSEKLWCEKVDFGNGEEPRQILSGLRHFYKKEDMQDRVVMVLCNLKKKKLGGIASHGMVLCASNADHTAVEFAVPPKGAKLGERVMFEGLEGEPKPENQVAKKKILEKLAPDLKTDSNGVVVWKGIMSVTSAGPCVAVNGMKDAHVS